MSYNPGIAIEMNVPGFNPHVQERIMRSYGIFAVAALVLSSGVPVLAESFHPQLDSKHNIVLGGYWQKVDAEFFAGPAAYLSYSF